MINNYIKAIAIKHQEKKWIEAAFNRKHRGLSIKSLWDNFLQKFFSKRKNYPSFLSDYVIVGNNPIINMLLLYKINNQRRVDEKIKVTFIIQNQPDYWDYSIAGDKVFLDLLNEYLQIDKKNIEEIFEEIIYKINKENIELCFLNSEEWNIQYHRYDSLTKSWSLFLFNNTNKKDINIHEYFLYQNQIREKINTFFIKKLKGLKAHKEIKWFEKKPKKKFQPIIIAKNMFITSIPQGWINSEYDTNVNEVNFKNELTQYSYGSSIKTSINQQNLKEISIENVKELFK